MQQWKLPTLKDATNHLEDAIITLSGPALAVSGIIAGVDLLTGGTMLKDVSWLAMAWAICLLLTLDFQVLSLGARAHQIYQGHASTKRKIFEMVLAILIASAISYVSIQMQSIIARANVGMSIEQATVQLGINPIALIWERSALVLVLIFMSGWFREEVKHPVSSNVSSVPSETPDETPSTISDETVQLILSKLAKLDQLEQVLAARSVVVQEAPETPLALPETTTHTDETPEIEGDESSLEAQIVALLAIKPDVSSREVAAIVGKPHSTVYRYLARVKQQVKQSA